MHSNLLQLAPDSKNNIQSIYKVQTGKNCNCFCPICNEPLIAKNKNKISKKPLSHGQKMAHFAHESGSDCIGAGESALHLMAKEVLKEFKTLMLPKLIYKGLELINKQSIVFDKVELERRLNHKKSWIVPDSILYKNDKSLFIEFYKSHQTEDEKIEKIKNINISCLEINVNHIDPLKDDGEVNKDGLRKLLEHETEFKYWLHNSIQEELYKKKIDEENELKAIKKKKKELIKEKFERKKKLEDNKWEAKIRKEEELQELNYQKEEKAYEECKKIHLSKLRLWEKERISDGNKLLKVYPKTEIGFIPIVYCPEQKSIGENEIRMKYFDCQRCRFNNGFVGYQVKTYTEVQFACGFLNKVMNKERIFIDPFTKPPKREDFVGIFDKKKNELNDYDFFI